MKLWQLLCFPISLLIGLLAQLRRMIFRINISLKVKLPIPVISVGNLTMGGTGKTPVTEYLLTELISRGKRPAVIARAYRASQIEPAEILNVTGDSALQFGDEPVQIKSKFPNARVFVGRSKSEVAAKFLLEDPSVDVVIVDDGFQHLKLHRDLNIALLDANEMHYCVFPSGRGREFESGIADANLVMVTKLENQISKPTLAVIAKSASHQIPIVHSKMISSDLTLDQKRKQLVVFSGLGKNDFFFDSFKGKGFSKLKFCGFPDHHRFTAQDISKLCSMGSKEESLWICTDKDYTKVHSLWPAEYPLHSVSVHVQIVSGKEKLDAALDKLFS